MFAWAYHNIPQLTLVALRFMKFKNNGAAQVARFIGSYLPHPSGLRERLWWRPAVCSQQKLTNSNPPK